MRRSEAALIVAAAVTAALMAAAVYLPDVGRGFVKDDFTWIRDAQATLAHPWSAITPKTPGFYRPLVTASFAFDYALHGRDARGYGFSNFAMYVLCVAAIGWLLHEAGAKPAGIVLGTFAWALNPHGINMAVVWLSGRTSLLLVLCSTLGLISCLRGHRLAAALFVFGALLSKEEATLVPAIVIVWMAVLKNHRGRALALDAAAAAIPLVVYLVLRSQTPAMTPFSAPWFYAPTFDPRQVAANTVEYFDRSLTVFAIIALAAAVAYRSVDFTNASRRQLIAGAAWFIAGLGLTVWLPVRSSLYAVFPSVGAALILAAMIDGIRGPHPLPERDEALAGALAFSLLFVPGYQLRNDRYVEPARVSARIIRAIESQPPPVAAQVIVLEDEPVLHSNFTNAFGSLASEAMSQAVHRPIQAYVTRSPVAPVSGAVTYRLTGGRVDRIQ